MGVTLQVALTRERIGGADFAQSAFGAIIALAPLAPRRLGAIRHQHHARPGQHRGGIESGCAGESHQRVGLDRAESALPRELALVGKLQQQLFDVGDAAADGIEWMMLAAKFSIRS